MFERIVNMTIRFFVGVWVVRYLGPDHYGVYSYVLSLAVLFETFTALGLDNIVVRECSRDRVRNDKVLATAFWLRFGGAVVGYAAVASTVLSLEESWLVQIAVLIIACRMFFNTSLIADFWFQSQIQSKYSVYVRGTASAVAAGLQVAAILADLGVLVFIAILVVRSAVQALGFAIAMRQRGPSLRRLLPSAQLGRRLLRDAWPLMISAFSTMVYMKVDQIMLRSMVGEAEVGIYASAVKLSEVWYFLPMAIANSVFPEIVRSREQVSPERYQRRLQRFYDALAALAYGVAIPVSLLAPVLVPLLFGQEYAGAVPTLQIHVWSFVFIALGVGRGKWLVAENMTKIAMGATVLGALTNVGINWFVIPNHGGIGAAWATMISYAIYAYFALALVAKTRFTFWQLSKAIVAPVRYLRQYVQ
jgi:PST family polysaccharide transporter